MAGADTMTAAALTAADVGRLLDVPRETLERLEALCGLVRQENERQSLVARSTLDDFWRRHILDSAQLLSIGASVGTWVDVGSGAGFPGLVVALLRADPVVLIEPRRLRAEFLRRAADALGCTNVSVQQSRVEAVRAPEPAAVISARAVASLESLFAAAEHLAVATTTWVLPRGRHAQSELAAARERWHGRFNVVASCTEVGAEIVVATNVRAREG